LTILSELNGSAELTLPGAATPEKGEDRVTLNPTAIIQESGFPANQKLTRFEPNLKLINYKMTLLFAIILKIDPCWPVALVLK
jgi:hypothetical protein